MFLCFLVTFDVEKNTHAYHVLIPFNAHSLPPKLIKVTKGIYLPQVAQLCQREVRKIALKSQRASKEVSLQPRARRLMREGLIYWRRYERVEKEQRKKAEREALEQRKIDDEMREVWKRVMI